MKLIQFKVSNYRNILDSGWIDTNEITAFVGQNEAGKSNLFDALYRVNPFIPNAKYIIEEDWPVDNWGEMDNSAIVCETKFLLDKSEIEELYREASLIDNKDEDLNKEGESSGENVDRKLELPSHLTLIGSRRYNSDPKFELENNENFDSVKVENWAKRNVPKFVLIQDYELTGTQIDLKVLNDKITTKNWDQLSNEDQTIKIILDLAKIEIKDFLKKGDTPEGRTIRSFDKRAASKYLSKQFKDLWSQKDVCFEIEIDGTTLNIFAEDQSVGMPVRLNRRSNGFRWHVSFAWKFTHASQGQYKNCILLLEEPGIHLHYSGQRDLLELFERLSASNSILYTTHLASMVDLANPERIRIVENRDNHGIVKQGVVSSQPAPMAVIEISLGLTPNMSGLLGSRKTLIVEGGGDALILYKLSGLLKKEGKQHLSDNIYLWPAQGASKTPMYAAFAVGQGWDSGVLLDTDEEGNKAKEKINNEILKKIAKENKSSFRILMLGESVGIDKTDVAIEDILGEQFYLKCVNEAYGINISKDDLPVDGSTMITKRIEAVLRERYSRSELDKRIVMNEIFRQFDKWESIDDITSDSLRRFEELFKRINIAFQSS